MSKNTCTIKYRHGLQARADGNVQMLGKTVVLAYRQMILLIVAMAIQ
jgi:hypothetical protein